MNKKIFSLILVVMVSLIVLIFCGIKVNKDIFLIEFIVLIEFIELN